MAITDCLNIIHKTRIPLMYRTGVLGQETAGDIGPQTLTLELTDNWGFATNNVRLVATGVNASVCANINGSCVLNLSAYPTLSHGTQFTISMFGVTTSNQTISQSYVLLLDGQNTLGALNVGQSQNMTSTFVSNHSVLGLTFNENMSTACVQDITAGSTIRCGSNITAMVVPLSGHTNSNVINLRINLTDQFGNTGFFGLNFSVINNPPLLLWSDLNLSSGGWVNLAKSHATDVHLSWSHANSTGNSTNDTILITGDGLMTYAIQYSDLLGHSSSTNVTVRVDSDKPEVQATRTLGQYIGRGTSMVVNATDETTGIEWVTWNASMGSNSCTGTWHGIGGEVNINTTLGQLFSGPSCLALTSTSGPLSIEIEAKDRVNRTEKVTIQATFIHEISQTTISLSGQNITTTSGTYLASEHSQMSCLTTHLVNSSLSIQTQNTQSSQISANLLSWGLSNGTVTCTVHDEVGNSATKQYQISYFGGNLVIATNLLNGSDGYSRGGFDNLAFNVSGSYFGYTRYRVNQGTWTMATDTGQLSVGSVEEPVGLELMTSLAINTSIHTILASTRPLQHLPCTTLRTWFTMQD